MIVETEKRELVKLSVVIPSHGRVDLLERLLLSLRKSIMNYGLPVEVIIVDSSPPDQQKTIIDLCQDFGSRYLRGSTNVREKRNLGIEEARGEIVLFVDSDCEVSENALAEHVRMYDESPTDAVLGMTEFAGKETRAWQVVKRTKFIDAFFFAKTLKGCVDSAPWGTCTNLSVRKEILQKLQGFDTDFPFLLGGDDTELGIRIVKAGYKIKLNPESVVFHTRETWNSLLSVAKRAFRWGRVDYHVFYRKHKDKLSISFPKTITIFLFFLPLSLIEAIMGSPLLAFILPMLWLLTFLFLNSAIKITVSKERMRNLFFEMLAQFLHLLFDFGTGLESLRNRDALVFFKLPFDDPRQVIVLWKDKTIEMWSATFSVLVVLLLTLVI